MLPFAPAARIEGLTKELGTPILASQVTRELAGESFAWTKAREMAVRGKAKPVQTFAPSRQSA
ncbi:MAG: hypothetical protein ACYC8T_14880 [Myxococcaceae bacterium]